MQRITTLPLERASILRPRTKALDTGAAALAIDEARPTGEAIRAEHKLCFPSHDGTAIFYRHWPSLADKDRRAVVLLHREHEHSGRLHHLPQELGLDDFAFFAWDARGHGCSPGPRGESAGADQLVRDLDSFIQHIATQHGIERQDLVVIGQGMGGVIATTWVHDYATRVRGVVLVAPAFKRKCPIPFARTALEIAYRLRGDFPINLPPAADRLTHDAARIAAYDQDPLITRPISVRLLSELEHEGRRMIENAPTIDVPLQLLMAGKDSVVSARSLRTFFDRLGSKAKECHAFQCFYHDVLGERGRHFALTKVREFVIRQFERGNASR
jgi:alpha-beta hydrolase superfamily lysophospholipase